MNRRASVGTRIKMSVAVAAVATALTSAAAMAQTSVSISGWVLLNRETIKANGATAGNAANIRLHDRIVDGGSSQITFRVTEDLGGGNYAFAQVMSTLVFNADCRFDALGNFASTGGCGLWGDRPSGIGIYSNAAGRFAIGVWPVHYARTTEFRGLYSPGAVMGGQAGAFGAASTINPSVGAIYSNAITWNSPLWNGFSLVAAYARPTDGPPPNLPGDVRDDRRNRVWNFAPAFDSGRFGLGYSRLIDKDAVTNTSISFAGTSVAGGVVIPSAWKIAGHRLSGIYRFANGLNASAIFDFSDMSNITYMAGGQIRVKRTFWALPISYVTGAHGISVTYGKASNWSGSIGGASLQLFKSRGYNLGSDTGAKFASVIYTYNLSNRTALYAGAQKILNRPLARYDFTDVPSILGTGNYGADPQGISLGIRHVF